VVILRVPQTRCGTHEDIVQSGGGLIQALVVGLATLQLGVLLPVCVEVVRIAVAVLVAVAAVPLFCDFRDVSGCRGFKKLCPHLCCTSLGPRAPC